MLNNISQRKLNNQIEEETYHNKSGDLILDITHRWGKDIDEINMNLKKGSEKLIVNYRLPYKNYGMQFIRITDSKILIAKGGGYRIILFSTDYECPETYSEYVWFLKYQQQCDIVRVVGLSNMNSIQSKYVEVYGNAIITLPYFEGFPEKQFTVPLAIKANDSISISPLLSQGGKELLKKVFTHITDERVHKLEQQADTVTLHEYSVIKNQFTEYITEQSIAY